MALLCCALLPTAADGSRTSTELEFLDVGDEPAGYGLDVSGTCSIVEAMQERGF